MSQITELNEILLRFAGGKLTGSKKIEVTRYYDDETGKEIGDVSSPAIPVGLPLAEEILGKIAGAAVAKTEEDAVTIADLTSERDTLTADLQAMTIDRDQQKAIADAVPGLQEQIAGLNTQITTLNTDHAAATKTIQAEKSELTQQVVTIASERNALAAKVESMSEHPDVIADRKAKAIAEAKAIRAKAEQDKIAAEKKLEELGEVVDVLEVVPE